MQIRPIKKEDVSACAAILVAAYARPPYNETFEGDNAALYIQGKFSYCEPYSFIAEEDGKIVGFMFNQLSTWTNGKQAVFEEIAVDPNFQGKGIGTALIAHSEEFLKSLGVKSIMFWAKNDQKLIDFYKKYGATVGDPVVMFKNL